MLSREEVAARIQNLPPEQQAEAADLALRVYGPAKSEFDETRYEPERYIAERLCWEPWRGTPGHPGQQEVLDAYVLALRQQHERNAYESGELTYEGDEALWRSADGQVTRATAYWKPGQVIKNRIRVEAGHTVGKTKLASGIVNHFLDHFVPSIIYTFAPGWDQVKDLLWKEIADDRKGKGLPGRVLETCKINLAPNHFARGRATNNAGGRGTHRIHGQHNKYLMFVVDEAEGVADFVFSAIDSMTSGGICIVVMLANPETRTSRFHKAQAFSNVVSFRISSTHHPNVLAGHEVVPGAVKRQYVEEMIEQHCEVVEAHSDDDHTFELPYPVQVGEAVHPSGTVFKPNAEFMFRVLGIAPANVADNTLIPVGRYQAATKREAGEEGDYTRARAGVDVARFGKDFGTLFFRCGDRLWRAAQFWKQDSKEYTRVIKEDCLALALAGVRDMQLRIDGGGGFASGLVDNLRSDMELREAFAVFKVFEVHFNATARSPKSYDNLITEMYAETAETLKGVSIEDAPEALEADLCEREYGWVNRAGVEVKRLEEKKKFRKRVGRSPDDGDGCVLCASPDYLFVEKQLKARPVSIRKTSNFMRRV